MSDDEYVRVSVSDLTEVILLWRSTQEAPGGMPSWKACQAMREPIWRMELALREQTGRTSEGVPAPNDSGAHDG